MPRKKRHLLTSFGLLLSTATLGAAITTVVARAILLSTTKTRLQAYASNFLEKDDEVSASVNATLDEADAATDPACSEADLTHLRALLFRSPYLKDVGRKQDGQFLCSAIVGKETQPLPGDSPGPGSKLGDRVVHYNVPLTLSPDFQGEIVSSARSNAVLSPNLFDELHRPPLFFSAAAVDRGRDSMITTYSNAPIPPTTDLMMSGTATRRDGYLFYSQCSNLRPDCVLTGIPLKYVWAPNRPIILSAIILGALIGLSFSGTALFMDLRRKTLPRQLRRALRNGELSVVYQPVVEVHTTSIVGAEALVRWTDEDGGPVGPELFISIAEQHGFVGEITTFVLDSVIKDLGDLLRTNPGFRVSINMSAQDLIDPGFIPNLDYKLRVNRIPAACIGLELTERSTADRTHVIEVIRALRSRGHVLYIDDFGTGYSSLAYLHELSVDILKVDRSFTRTIGTNSIIASILPQILSMARALELQVIVEGVELAEQAEYLRKIDGLVYAQGWLYGEPCPSEKLRKLVGRSA